jgi:hypothetical protein
MTISNTVEQALAAAGFNSANWVPEHEPYAHILTQTRFAMIALFGNEDIDPEAKFDKTKIKKVPALIKSTPSSSMNPKIDQYTTLPTTFTVNGAVTGLAAGADKTVTLVSTAGIKAYDVHRDKATGSEVIVISVTNTTQYVVRPFTGGVSGDGSDNIANGATLEFVNNAYQDGATFGDGFRSTPAQNSNYMQISIEEYGIGFVEEELKKYPGESNQFMTRRQLARIRHNHGREMRMLFGSSVANTTAVSGATIYGAAGLLGLSTREINAGGSITMDEWNSDIMPLIAQYGSGDYHAMLGSKAGAVWTNLAAELIQTTRQDRVYGNKVKRIETAVENLVLHPTEPMNRRDGEMLFFQPGMLERKYFPKFNSVHLTAVGARNVAKNVNAYMTVETLIPRNQDVICLVKGVLA